MEIAPVRSQTYWDQRSFKPENISQSKVGADTVTLSAEGKAANARSLSGGSLLGSLDNFMDGAGKDGVITLEEIKAFGEKNLEETERILEETLRQLGISSDHDMDITTDRYGVVKVDSTLSDDMNQRLESALNEHPGFQQAYIKASSSQGMLNEAERYMEFAEAYARDPQAAVAQFGIGDDNRKGEYLLNYHDGVSKIVHNASFALS